MASMNDEALEAIWEEGGKAHVHRVAGKMKISADYARTILYCLGRQDFLDIGSDDIATITKKGKEALEQRGIFRKINDEKEKAEKKETEERERKSQRRTLGY